MSKYSRDIVESDLSEIFHKNKSQKSLKLTEEKEMALNPVSSYDTIYADTIFLNDYYSHTSTVYNPLDSKIEELAWDKYLSSRMLNKSDSISYSKTRNRSTIDDINVLTKGDTYMNTWNRYLPGTSTLESSLTHNKFACCLNVNDTFEILYETLRYNIFVFVIELCSGPMEDNEKLLFELRRAKHFLSGAINNPIQNSLLSKITIRHPTTGLLKIRSNSVLLKKGNKIIVTADRRYSQLGSKNVIYVNCVASITKLKPCDYILIDKLRVKVIEQSNISAMCEIICGGMLKGSMPVILPQHCLLNENIVTPEEMDDIELSQSEKINCIILPTCNCDYYFNSIQDVLKTLDFCYCRLFATVSASEIDSIDKAKLISEKYDGINLNIYNSYSEKPKIIQLSEPVKYLIEQFYLQKKPILIGQLCVNDMFENQSVIIHPDSLKHILYYPDKFVLQVTELKFYIINTYLNIFENHKYAMIEFTLSDLKLPLINLTSETEIIARSIVKTAFDCDAKCIILTSVSGRMAIKISHFRPKIPIIVLVDNLNIVRFLCVYHNIWIVYYKTEANYSDSIRLKKLVCGLIYAITHDVLMETDNIVYVYESLYAQTHKYKMSVMKMSNSLLQKVSS